MTKKTRLIILLSFVACFFLIAPILVAYSMGYRFDFEKIKVVATGGIYVRTFPTADLITIDSDISQKPGLFANWIFVQSLLPKTHTVLVKKNGYHEYAKTLPVKENQVTKIENVLLIKKDIKLNILAEKIDYFSIAPNNQNIITSFAGEKNITFNYYSLNSPLSKQIFSISKANIPSQGQVSSIKWAENSKIALIEIKGASNTFYYIFNSALATPAATRLTYLDKNSKQISFNPQDLEAIFYINGNTLYSAKQNRSVPILNNVASFRASGSAITWLSTKGILSNSDFFGKLIAQITSENFTLESKKEYEIVSIIGSIYLKESNSLFKFDQEKKAFQRLAIPLSDYEILTSPDNKNLIYQNKNKIFLYSFLENKYEELFSGDKVGAVQWLNNDYIIFKNGDNIMISEIDYRGNVNAVTLANMPNPMIFLDKQDVKLFVLSGGVLSESEKLVP